MQNLLHIGVRLACINVTEEKLVTYYNYVCKPGLLYKVFNFKCVTFFMNTVLNTIVKAFLFKFFNAVVHCFYITISKCQQRLRCKGHAGRHQYIKIDRMKERTC